MYPHRARWWASAVSTSRPSYRTRRSMSATPAGRCAKCVTKYQRNTTWGPSWNSMSRQEARPRPILISRRIDSVERVGRHLVVLSIALAVITGCSKSPVSPSLPRGNQQTRIYVADWANHRIVRMNDMHGGGWTTLGGVGSGGEQVFQFPVGVCVDASRRIYVSQQYHHRVFRMDDMLGSNRMEYSNPSATDKPVNKYAGSWICVDRSGRIYVTYDGEHAIVRMDNMSGAGRVSFGTEGSGVGELRFPAGVAVDERGRIYVCDFDNFRIVRIDDMQGS